MARSNGTTLYDVAAKAGVSGSTVSRLLHPRTRGLVNPRTAAKIEKAIAELGYEPNQLARGLKTDRSYMVGAMIPDITNPLFPPIVQGLQHRLELDGYVALVASIDGDRTREKRIFDVLSQRRVDGFIIATAAHLDRSAEWAIDAGVPTVLVNRRSKGDPLDAVVPDSRGGIAKAVDYLVGLGHRRIGHLAGPRGATTGSERRSSFCASMKKRRLPLPAGAVVEADAFTEAAGEAYAGALLDLDGERLTAIVAANDLLAFGCYSALEKRGLKCPRDVSVVGFNDMLFADRVLPPLTTVHYSHAEMGLRAAEILLGRIEGTTVGPPKVVVLDSELVIRGSVAPPRD